MGTWLDRAQIDAARSKTLRIHPIEVPEWGGTVGVRLWTGAEREEFADIEAKANASDDPIRAMLEAKYFIVVRSLVDQDGTPYFPDDDTSSLRRHSGELSDRLFDIVVSVNGLGSESIEDLQGKSKAARSDDGGSD